MKRPPEWDEDRKCVRCGESVEEARRCYAVPTCFACLPPPEPLPTLEPLCWCYSEKTGDYLCEGTGTCADEAGQ